MLALGAGRTRLRHSAHRGPLRVQRPFYPPGSESAHLYLLHPPGGVVGGDQLEIEVALEAGAAALLTTPAAGKFYRCAGRASAQRVQLSVAAGATLEWLPQENIVFEGAQASATTRVDLAGDARFAGWEITCLGRRGAGEGFARGSWLAQLGLYRDGRPLLIDRLQAEAGSALMQRPWGLAGHPVSATLACSGVERELGPLARTLREAAAAIGSSSDAELCSVSALDGVLVCRYLGGSAARARAQLGHVWQQWRAALGLGPGHPPRIWLT